MLSSASLCLAAKEEADKQQHSSVNTNSGYVHFAVKRGPNCLAIALLLTHI